MAGIGGNGSDSGREPGGRVPHGGMRRRQCGRRFRGCGRCLGKYRMKAAASQRVCLCGLDQRYDVTVREGVGLSRDQLGSVEERAVGAEILDAYPAFVPPDQRVRAADLGVVDPNRRGSGASYRDRVLRI